MRLNLVGLKTYQHYLRRGLLSAFAVSASALLFMIATMLTDESLLALFALLIFVGTAHYAGKFLFPERKEWFVVYLISPFALMWAGVFGVVFATFKPDFLMILTFAVTLQLLGTILVAVCFGLYRLLNRVDAALDERRRSLSEA